MVNVFRVTTEAHVKQMQANYMVVCYLLPENKEDATWMHVRVYCLYYSHNLT
jgi:hypothetical protein